MMHDALALAFLLAIPLGLVLWGIIWTWRSPFNFPQAILLLLAVLLTRLLWRAQIPARLPLAPGEGAIVIANHRSSIDPFFLQVIADRPMHWMVAREYCEHWAFRWFLRTCGVIPVSRSGVDTAAIKQAIRYARNGELLGMLPEGRINRSDQVLLPARPGAAMVAITGKLPILPVYIDGAPYAGSPASPLFMRARVRVRIGRPLYPPARQEGETGDERMSRFMVMALREVARLGGESSFEPQLAGRQWKPTDAELKAEMAASRRRR